MDKLIINGESFELDSRSNYLIGREAGNILLYKDGIKYKYIPTARGSVISEKHVQISYDRGNRMWKVTDLNSTNGTWIAYKESNWMKIKKPYYVDWRYKIVLGNPYKNVFSVAFGFTDSGELVDNFFKLLSSIKESEPYKATLCSIIKKLQKIDSDFSKNIAKHKWVSLWWWDSQERNEIIELNELLSKLESSGLPADEQERYLSIALKKIIYAHSVHNYALMPPDFTPKNLLEAIQHVKDMIEGRMFLTRFRFKPIEPPIVISREEMKKNLIKIMKDAVAKKINYYYDAYVENYNKPEEIPPDCFEKVEAYLSELKANGQVLFVETQSGDRDVYDIKQKAGTFVKYRYYFNVKFKYYYEFIKILMEELLLKIPLVNERLKFKLCKPNRAERIDRFIVYSTMRLDNEIIRLFSSKSYMFNDAKHVGHDLCYGIFSGLELKGKNILEGHSFGSRIKCNPADEHILSAIGNLHAINGLENKSDECSLSNYDIILFYYTYELYMLRRSGSFISYSKDGVEFKELPGEKIYYGKEYGSYNHVIFELLEHTIGKNPKITFTSEKSFDFIAEQVLDELDADYFIFESI